MITIWFQYIEIDFNVNIVWARAVLVPREKSFETRSTYPKKLVDCNWCCQWPATWGQIMLDALYIGPVHAHACGKKDTTLKNTDFEEKPMLK